MADGLATTISGIETPDELTVKFTLSQPDATFLNVLALNFSSWCPKEVVEAEGADFGKKPVGSGAFKLDEWVPGQRLVFSRNARTLSATAQILTASESKSARNRWLRPSGFRRAKWTSPATAYRW